MKPPYATALNRPVLLEARQRAQGVFCMYGDWVEEVDWSVGQVLEALKKLKLTE